MGFNIKVGGTNYHIKTQRSKKERKVKQMNIRVYAGEEHEITKQSQPILGWTENDGVHPRLLKQSCIKSIVGYRNGDSTYAM